MYLTSLTLSLIHICLTVGKKKYADVEEEMYELKAKCDQLQKDFLRLIERDAEVFEPLSKEMCIRDSSSIYNEIWFYHRYGTDYIR